MRVELARMKYFRILYKEYAILLEIIWCQRKNMPIRKIYMHEKNCLEYVGFKYFSCEILNILFHLSDDTTFYKSFDLIVRTHNFWKTCSHKENGTEELVKFELC